MTNRSHRRRQWGFLTAGLAMVLALVATAQAAEPKRIYIANDDHTDYLWTADEATYQRAFLEMLDFYLDLADATQANPPEHQSRWNCDGHFWLWVYEKNKSAADFNRLIERIRSGHISVPLNALAVCLGGAPTEAVLRGSYYAGQIERRHRLRFPLAYAMENQTLPYGLGALWAGCGAKYSWRGICACATRLPDRGRATRPHEMYHWGGPDGSRLLMKWYSIVPPDNQSLGGYAEARSPAAVVDFLDSDPAFNERYPFRVLGAFGKGWDDLKTLTNEFVTAAQRKTTPHRTVIVSNEVDFFEDFERTYPAGLPTVAASYGNEWDLYSASMAEVTARVRRSVEKLRGAEALATLVSIAQTNFMIGRSAARDLAFLNLGLYWEHDWTADSKLAQTARPPWHRRLAREIEAYVDSLQADAASALGSLIAAQGNRIQFYAFNPLSWARTDVADLAWSETNEVHVIDQATGAEAPSQIITNSSARVLRVLAQDVPAVGYKVYTVQPGPGTRFATAASVESNVMENAFYRVVVAGNGAITSWRDKTRGDRELVRAVQSRTLNDLGPGLGVVVVESAGPVSVTLRAEAEGPLKHTTRATLLRDSPRLEIHNEINQNFTNVAAWHFAFNLNAPDLWHEELGAVIRARLIEDGGHYASSHARYDWLTLNHFADLSGDDIGVTLSNSDCQFMRYGRSTPTVLDTGTPLLAVLAGGQVDGPKLGIPAQGGDSHFVQRFALRSRTAFDAADAMRFALEHQNPLITGLVTGGTAYPARNFSLLKLADPQVLLWALKPAEEGIAAGVMARVWNLSAESGVADISTAFSLTNAWRTTHLETDLAEAKIVGNTLKAPIRGRQLLTFRLQPNASSLAAGTR